MAFAKQIASVQHLAEPAPFHHVYIHRHTHLQTWAHVQSMCAEPVCGFGFFWRQTEMFLFMVSNLGEVP